MRSPCSFTRYHCLKSPHNSLQFHLTNTFDQFTQLSVGRGKCTRCKISITRNNLQDVLWQMLEASDEIDLKPSLRRVLQVFISVSNTILIIIFFGTCVFSTSLNKKMMNGRSKIFGKKDRSQCLFKSKQLFFSQVSLASKETYYSLDVRTL